jgi:hypothetical protein
LRRISVLGTPQTIEQFPLKEGFYRFRCVGPRCDGLTLDLHLQSDAAVILYVVTAVPGLPPGGDVLIAARPTAASPRSDGDTRLVFDALTLEVS